MSNSCPDDETLQAFLAGKLDDERVMELTQHFESCHACAKQADRILVEDPLIDDLAAIRSLTIDQERAGKVCRPDPEEHIGVASRNVGDTGFFNCDCE